MNGSRRLSLVSLLTGALTRQARASGLRPLRVDLPEAAVHAWIGGQGPPLLLLHGFGGDALATWSLQIPALVRHYRLILPDLLWFGQSQGGARPGLDEQAQAVLGLLDHLGVGTAHVAGISYGGFVAFKLLFLDPTRVDRLIICSSPGPLFSVEDEVALHARLGADSVEDVFVPEDVNSLRALLRHSFHRGPPLPDWLLRDIHRQLFAHNQAPRRALLADLISHRARLADMAPARGRAAAVLWGEHDPVFPAASGRRLAAALGAPFHLLRGSAHCPPMERPLTVNRVIREALAQAPARRVG